MIFQIPRIQNTSTVWRAIFKLDYENLLASHNFLKEQPLQKQTPHHVQLKQRVYTYVFPSTPVPL